MKRIALLLAALIALALPAAANTYGTTSSEVVRAEVLSGWNTPEGTRMVALRLILAPGWKTYWRAPGDAGIPPTFDWSRSQNLASVRIHWPRPTVFETAGMRTIGYKNELVLPIEITPRTAGAPVTFAAKVDLGVCAEICMPASFAFSTELAGKGAPNPLIEAALNARPMSAHAAGVGRVTCEIAPISDGIRVTAHIPAKPLDGHEVVVIESGSPRVWVSEASTTRRGNTITATAELVPPAGASFALSRQDLRFTLLGASRAIDILGCTAP